LAIRSPQARSAPQMPTPTKTNNQSTSHPRHLLSVAISARILPHTHPWRPLPLLATIAEASDFSVSQFVCRKFAANRGANMPNALDRPDRPRPMHSLTAPAYHPPPYTQRVPYSPDIPYPSPRMERRLPCRESQSCSSNRHVHKDPELDCRFLTRCEAKATSPGFLQDPGSPWSANPWAMDLREATPLPIKAN
jgi:hypothetical protein